MQRILVLLAALTLSACGLFPGRTANKPQPEGPPKTAIRLPPEQASSGPPAFMSVGQRAGYRTGPDGTTNLVEVVKTEAGTTSLRHSRRKPNKVASNCTVIWDGKYHAEAPPADERTMSVELRMRVNKTDGSAVERVEYVALRFKRKDAASFVDQAWSFLKYGHIRDLSGSGHDVHADAPLFLSQLAARRVLETLHADDTIAREDVTIHERTYPGAIRVELDMRSETVNRSTVLWAHTAVPATGYLVSTADGLRWELVEVESASQ